MKEPRQGATGRPLMMTHAPVETRVALFEAPNFTYDPARQLTHAPTPMCGGQTTASSRGTYNTHRAGKGTEADRMMDD